MGLEKPTKKMYEVAKRVIQESRFDIKNPALELILKDVVATGSGECIMAYKNRYPDYHNCCYVLGS